MEQWRLKKLRAQSMALEAQLAEGRQQLLRHMAVPYEVIQGHYISTHYADDFACWQLHMACDELPLMIFALECADPEDYLGAEAEAFEFVVASLMPVTRAGEEADCPSVVARDDGWAVWLPCRFDDGCGGFHLRLDLPRFEQPVLTALLSEADRQAVQRLEEAKARSLGERVRELLIQHRDCLGCVSTGIRTEGSTSSTAFLWFDCLGQDWQLWQPIGAEGVSLPLGLGGFNRPPGEIMTAARAIDPDFRLHS